MDKFADVFPGVDGIRKSCIFYDSNGTELGKYDAEYAEDTTFDNINCEQADFTNKKILSQSSKKVFNNYFLEDRK